MEDRESDILLIEYALKKAGLKVPLEVVTDGQAAIDRLTNGKPMPGLVLLDLNLPKKSGLEVLDVIKFHPRAKLVPVVVMTTSNRDDDVLGSYERYANAFVRKSSRQQQLVDHVKRTYGFWFETATLPNQRGPAAP